MEHQKLNSVKFGISFAVVLTAFVLLSEFFLLIKFVPYYNNLMLSVYNAGGITVIKIIEILFGSIIISLIIGFLFGFMLAWIYNKLLLIRIK